jgi:hypothetical protein
MRPKSISVPRMFVLVVLAAIFTLGFIITPYWTRGQSGIELILVLILTIVIGTIWSFLSAGDLRIGFAPINWGYFVILLVGLVILNLMPLIASIPWRGDEDVHIERTVALISVFGFRWAIPFLVAFGLWAYLAWKKSLWTIFLGILFISGTIAFTIIKHPLALTPTSNLLRYPYINYWLFAIIPKLAMFFRINPYQEVFFRIVPFLSTFALLWVFQKRLSGSDTLLNLLWGMVAATIPLVYYYSSILYVEMPAVFLMFLVLINMKSLLQDDFQKIKQTPAWYGLILIGFIKETTLPFLLCFLGWRIVTSLLRWKVSPPTMKFRINSLYDETRIVLAVLLPVLFYLFLRSSLSQQSRGYTPSLSNLTNIVLYQTIFQSFLDQLGLPLLLLFGGVGFLLVLEKQYLHAGILFSFFFLYPFFFATDSLIYTGYSRFNLFVLPPLLAGVSILIKRLNNYRKIFGVAAACAILAINLAISPVFIDGSKKPLWGNYLSDTSDHYYPYREALAWLKANDGNAQIMFAGMYYPYPFQFYFDQLQWMPKYTVLMTDPGVADSDSLSRTFAQAGLDKFDIVLFQVLGNKVPPIKEMGQFSEEIIFKNDAHTLVVYERKP